jgi:hypothetical protein
MRVFVYLLFARTQPMKTFRVLEEAFTVASFYLTHASYPIPLPFSIFPSLPLALLTACYHYLVLLIANHLRWKT